MNVVNSQMGVIREELIGHGIFKAPADME